MRNGEWTEYGLLSEFARLAKSEPSIDPSFARFLAEAHTS